MAEFQITVPIHATSDVVEEAVTLWHIANQDIPDRVAVAIAAMWMSPGRRGNALASLATGAPREYNDILEDIENTLNYVKADVLPLRGKLHSPMGWTYRDVVSLEALLDWFEQFKDEYGEDDE